MNKRAEEKQVIISSLKTALLLLLKEKNFTDITIRELVTKAGVARSTFYRYFPNKIDFVRALIQQKIQLFDTQYQPNSIDERFESEYINEVWRFLAKYDDEVITLAQSGLAYLYLDELNHHLLEQLPHHLTTEEEIKLFGLAGAQFNIVFNLFAQRQATRH